MRLIKLTTLFSPVKSYDFLKTFTSVGAGTDLLPAREVFLENSCEYDDVFGSSSS